MAQFGNVLLLVVHPWFMQNNNLEVLLLIGAFENMSYVVSTLKVTGTNASVHWKKMGVIQLAWLKQYSKTAPYTSFSLILVNMVIWRQFKSQIML